MAIRELAYRLVDFAETVDPYGYSDAFESKEEAVTALSYSLENDREGIVEWLVSFVDEDDDTAIVKVIKSILDDIEKMGERRTA